MHRSWNPSLIYSIKVPKCIFLLETCPRLDEKERQTYNFTNRWRVLSLKVTVSLIFFIIVVDILQTCSFSASSPNCDAPDHCSKEKLNDHLNEQIRHFVFNWPASAICFIQLSNAAHASYGLLHLNHYECIVSSVPLETI